MPIGAETSADVLLRLAERFEALTLPESDPVLESHRAQVVRTVRSYLVPRILDPVKPMVVVFAGPTGAGKSTMLNSVAGESLSATGPLRPTTQRPVVFAAEGETGLRDLLGEVDFDLQTGRAPILGELTLVDTPDIDSTALEHRAVAEALIDVADLVVFVSSALRYADGVPWEVLRRARARGAPVIAVLNRVRSSSDGGVADYRRLLEGEGLTGDLVTVPEHHLPPGADAVPHGSIRQLRRRLVDAVEDRRSDETATLRRVMTTTYNQASGVLERLTEHADAAADLSSKIATRIRLGDGPLLHEYPSGTFPVDHLRELAGRPRWRVRRRARKVLPAGEQLHIEQLRLVERLIAAQETSLRRRLEALRDPQEISEVDYEVIRFCVERWAAADQTTVPASGRLRGPVGLLMQVAAVTREKWPRTILATLLPDEDITDSLEELEQALRADLGWAYERASAQAKQAMLAPLSSPEEIEDAHDALVQVIARTSFADA